MRPDLPEFNEEYVCDILAATKPGLTRQKFRTQCRFDINGGWWREVNEAERRYFEERANAKARNRLSAVDRAGRGARAQRG